MAKRNPFKGPIILTVIALGILLLTKFVLIPQKEASEKNKDAGNLLFSNIDRKDLIEIKIESQGSAIFIKQKADNSEAWIVSEGQKSFEGDKSVIDGIISSLMAAKKESTISNNDLASLGLAPAKYKLTVTLRNNPSQQSTELWVGEDTPVDYLSFAKWADKPEIILTSRSLRFSLDKKASDLRNRKVLDLPFPLAQSLRVRPFSDSGARLPPIELKRNEKGEWSVGQENSKNTAQGDPSEIQRFFETLNTLTVTGFPTDNPAERNKYGFSSPVASFAVEIKDDKTTRNEVWVLARATDKSSGQTKPTQKYFLAKEGDPSVYEVSETFKDNLKVDLFKFRPKKIIEFDKAAVTSLSLQDGKNSFEISRDGSNWTVSGGSQNLSKVPGKSEVVGAMLDTLLGLRAKAFHDSVGTWAAGMRSPTRILEIRGKKGSEEIQTLGTVIFGAKIKDKDYYARSQDMEAPATVEVDLEGKFPMDPNQFADLSQKISSTQSEGSASKESGQESTLQASKGEKKKVKLEPTVKTTKEIKKLPASIVKPGHKYTAEIEISSGTKLEITFAADKAPYTVSNFLHLARNGFYNNVKFHRVIPNFVAQGGDPTGTGAGGPGYEFDNENNDLKHVRGALSMAHRGPNTNGSQFFIVLAPQKHLDGIHPVFGSITKGIELIDGIKQGDVMKKVEVFEEAL